MKFFTKVGWRSAKHQRPRYLPLVIGTTSTLRPTTLSARAARVLADGPCDVVALMRAVCQVERLQRDAAERMAQALFGSRPEFVCLPTGWWALADAEASASGPVDVAGATLATLRTLDFAVVDVETTGTHAGGTDRITEIAIVRVRGGEVGEVYSQLVNPERPIPPHITALTQITWAMVRDQPTFSGIAEAVRERLQGAIFTAHNASFDWRFVSEEFQRATGRELTGPRLCTVRMSRAFLPELSRRTLDHLTRHFGIEIAARHRAAGDALATAHALVRLLQIAEREGVASWADLEARVGRSGSSGARTASARRRRAFPLPMTEDESA